jgi:hypothetical protein
MEVKRITKSQLKHFNIFLNKFITLLEVRVKGVTKRCRLYLQTNLATSYMSPNAGGGLGGLSQ